MRTLEDYAPRRGLSVPIVSCLSADGEPNDADQRRLVRYLIQAGRGADVIFVMGTTGEWNKLDQRRRHRVIRVVVEETRKHEATARAGRRAAGRGVGRSLRADARRDARDPRARARARRARRRDRAARDQRRGRSRALPRSATSRTSSTRATGSLPIFLYDNADISAGREAHLRTRAVKELSRLDFVRGIKVSAPPRRLGHYTKAARTFRDLGAFDIYVGEALQILRMMRPHTGFWGVIREHWNRFLLHDLLAVGGGVGSRESVPARVAARLAGGVGAATSSAWTRSRPSSAASRRATASARRSAASPRSSAGSCGAA